MDRAPRSGRARTEGGPPPRIRLSGVAWVAGLLTALGATACGPGSGSSRLGGEAEASALQAVNAFEADLDAGRTDDALRRTTVAFQGAAQADAIRQVAAQLREALGARTRRGAVETSDAVTEGDPPRPRSAVLAWDAAFERGSARVRARVEHDAVRGAWLVDGYEVRGARFTWTLRR